MKKRSLPPLRWGIAVLLNLLFFNLSAQTDYTIGNGVTTNTNLTYPCPIPDYYEGCRQQYLYRNVDLLAAGMPAGGGNITAVKFEVTNLNLGSITNGNPLLSEQFTIKVMTTSLTALTTTGWVTGATTVFGPVNYSPTLGINTFTFPAPLAWDGTTGILVEICNGDPANGSSTMYSTNPSFAYTTVTGVNVSRMYRADNNGNLCGYTGTLTTGGFPNRRPNAIFTLVPTSCSGTPNQGQATSDVTTAACSVQPNLNLTGGTAGGSVTYTWQSSPDGLTGWANVTGGVGLTSPAFTPAAITATTHYRVITTCGTSGLSNTSLPVQVTVNSNIAAGTIASGSGTAFCNSASPTLTLSGHTSTGTTIQWQSSPNGSTWTNVGTNSTTYAVPGITSSLLYRAQVICTATATTATADPILINVAPDPVVGINPSSIAICSGNSTTLTANGATSYSWAPGGATTAAISVSPTSNTTYTVTGTLGSCTATATSSVSVGTPFTAGVIANPTAVCVGGSTTLSATAPVPAGAYCTPAYTSGTNLNDYIANVVMPGTTLSNASGANGPSWVVYPQTGNTTASLTAGNTYTIQVTVGTAGSQRVAAWIDYNSNGVLDNTGELLASPSGAIAANGTHTIIFTVPANTLNGTHRLRTRTVWGTTGNTQTPCSSHSWGQAEDYDITITGGVDYVAVAPYTVAWTESVGSTTLASTTANPVTASNIDVNKVYSVTVSKDGCSSTANVTVNANPLPTATMTTSTPTVCDGQSPVLNFTGTPNTNVVYSINGVNQPSVAIDSSGSATVNATAISINTAYALVSATNPATTCSATLSGGFTVNVNQRPAGQFIGTSIVCKDMPAFIGFGSPSGGTVFPIYVTYSDGTNTYLDTAAGAGENFPVPSNIPGIYNYTLTALTSANGCAAIASDMNGTATVEVKALPTAVVSSADPGVCPGGSTDVTLTFTGDAPFSFLYYDGTATVGNTTSTNSFTFTATPTETDTFYVQNLLDNNVCLATPAELADSAIVVVYDTTTITSQPAASLSACSQTAVTITMSAIGQNPVYTWYENGVAITPGPNYTINNNSLTINNVTGMGGNTYYVVVHSDCGNDQTSSTTTLTEDLSNSWSGTVSTDWNNPVNWSCNSVPIATTDVTITQGAPNMPVVEIPTAVCHDITLIGTASLSFVAGMQLSVYGDIANTTGGTINGTGGTIELAGTVQSVSGPVTLENLEVNGGGVKTFSTDVTVSGILNLVSGNIELGTGTLTLAQPTAQLGGSPTSFIVTNGTGRVIGNNMGAVGGNPDEVTFHVGINGSSYTPITLENLGDADNFSVRVMENVYEDGTGVIPTEVDNPVVDRTWLVEEGTAGGSIVTMTPAWNSTGDEVNGFVTTNVFVAHYLNGEWTSYVDSANAAPAADPGPYAGMLQTTQDSIMSFSPFTVASSGQFPLTIHLNSITATNVGPRNKVEWKSEKEDVGDSYELERSADGRKFTKMTTVAANGKPSTYTQWDEQPVMGVNYYRVKLLNNDGSYSYSRVVTATVKGQDGFSIEAYPNPVKNMVSVKIDGVVSGKATIAVTDVTGKIVKTATAVVNNAAELNVSELASGVYLINYTDEVRNESIKITKQ